MELVVKKEELVENLVKLLNKNLLESIAQNGITDEEEINAHIVLNRKKFAQEAENIANVVFVSYGVNS